MTHLLLLITNLFLERKKSKFITNSILLSVRLDSNSNKLRKQIFKFIYKIITLNFVTLLIIPKLEEWGEKPVFICELGKLL